MPTVEDLGRKVKERHPGTYNDLSDAEVGRRVKNKHPGAYDDFVEVGLSSTSVVSAEYAPEKSVTGTPVLSTPSAFTDANPEPIDAGANQTFYFVVSGFLWLVSAGLILTLCSGGDGASLFGRLVLGIGAGFGASQFWKKANEAFEEEKRDTGLKVDIKRNQIAFKAEEVREGQIGSEAARELELRSIRQETQAKAEIGNQKGLDLQGHLLQNCSSRF
jgi:hypothetical protein